MGLGKQRCSVLQEKATERELRWGWDMHCVDTSVSSVLLKKEPLLCHLHTEQKKWLLLRQGCRVCSKHTMQNKIKQDPPST